MSYEPGVKKSLISERMLRAMSPDREAEPPVRWQQRKSAQTRERLVQAGIDCLVENGYSGLSTAAVAERCAVSRGAMHHHFATRVDLVAAVVDHVFYHRMRGFLDDYFAALRERGEELVVEIACEAHWRSVQTREYSAYLELAVAARTDAELAGHFDPAAQRFDQIWATEMIEAFPQWRDQWEAMKLANDIVTATHMGLILNARVLDGDRRARVQGLLTDAVKSLYR